MEVLPLEGSVQRNACIFVNVLSIEYEWKQLFEPLDVRDNINTSSSVFTLMWLVQFYMINRCGCKACGEYKELSQVLLDAYNCNTIGKHENTI